MPTRLEFYGKETRKSQAFIQHLARNTGNKLGVLIRTQLKLKENEAVKRMEDPAPNIPVTISSLCSVSIVFVQCNAQRLQHNDKHRHTHMGDLCNKIIK